MKDRSINRLVLLSKVTERRLQYKLAVLCDAKLVLDRKREELTRHLDKIKKATTFKCTDFVEGKVAACYIIHQQSQTKIFMSELLRLENEFHAGRQMARSAFAKSESMRNIVKRLDVRCQR